LGHTESTIDPNAAMEIFLNREFPQLQHYKTVPHEAFLVPESFIYGGIAAQVLCCFVLLQFIAQAHNT
jgi:hypothetical protein